MIDRSEAAAPLIAHVIHRLDVGGLENGVVNLINTMPRTRYRHAVICLTDFEPSFRERITRDDVAVYALHKRPGKDLPHYLRLGRLLRQLSPAIVHTRNRGTVDAQAVAWACGVPGRIHGEHGWETGHDADDRHGRRLRRLLRPFIQRYIALSSEIETYLRAGVGVDEVRLCRIINGVDVSRFAPRARAGRAGEDLVIGTVGRLVPVKDQASLLQAFALLVKSTGGLIGDRRLVLRVIGDGPLRADLGVLARSLGIAEACDFAGACPDMPAAYRALDLFVLPSIAEGISNTVLEAMASGLPVVATDVGGNPELVTDGVTGTLVPPRMPSALADAMADTVSQPSVAVCRGQAGREVAVKRLSLAAMAGRYTSVYDDLLAERVECMNAEGS